MTSNHYAIFIFYLMKYSSPSPNGRRRIDGIGSQQSSICQSRCFWHNSPDNKTFYCLASFATDRIRNVPIFWFPTLITLIMMISHSRSQAVINIGLYPDPLRVIGWLLSRPRSLLPGSGPRNWIWWSQPCMDRNCLSLSWRGETFSD